MKKLGLLLGSLLMVGAVAQAKEAVVAPVVVEETVQEVVVAPIVVEEAKPWLRLTRVGQEIEIENESGGDNIGESVYFGNSIGLATDNWDFGVTAARFWSADTKEGLKKTNTRMQLDAMRKFKADSFKYSLGTRWRAQKDLDRFYLRGNYATNTGLFAGWVDLFYNSTTGSADSYVLETMPLNVKFGPLTLGYFLAHTEGVGGNKTSITEHQLRTYLDVYKGEKTTLKLENRLTLHKDGDNSEGKSIYGTRGGEYKFGGRNRTYAKVDYKVNEGLNVYVIYGYEIQDAEGFGRDTYYGDFIAGWNYKF
ncbi:hypothetical protein [Cetobacterium ceti]